MKPTKNITIEQTRLARMRNYFIKKFVPVYKRTMEAYAVGKGTFTAPRYEPWTWNYFMPSPTCIPHKIWPIKRVRVRRAGQLELPLNF